MARWAPLKKDQLEALASEILHNYGRGRAIVAVDGASDAGMTQFADDLAEAVGTLGHEVFRASIDDFRTPRSRREPRGRPEATAIYHDGYDYSLLQRVLLDPFRATSGTGFVLAAFDAERDAPMQSKWTTAGPDALLLIDGLFLNRPQLADRWNYSIWVELERPDLGSAVAGSGGTGAAWVDAGRHVGTEPRETSVVIGDAESPGQESDEGAATAGADAIYLAEADPRNKATAIIDNRNPDSPRRAFADSC
jgi:uridine kinase